jgi:arsenite methyltransferase
MSLAGIYITPGFPLTTCGHVGRGCAHINNIWNDSVSTTLLELQEHKPVIHKSKTALALLSTLIIAGCGPQPSHTPQTRPRIVSPLFDPAQARWKLEGPERDKWQQPHKLVNALGIKPGATVADIGAGSGYLLPYLSRAVGNNGKVYAEEIQEAYLPALRKHAGELKNVEVVLGNAENPKLRGRDVDCFVLLTVYHEVQQPVDFLRVLHKYARQNARLAIIDFDANRKGDPPAPQGHEVAERDVIAEATAAGWKLETRHEFLGSQFYLVFK